VGVTWLNSGAYEGSCCLLRQGMSLGTVWLYGRVVVQAELCSGSNWKACITVHQCIHKTLSLNHILCHLI
jgi:hypothetical protein